MKRIILVGLCVQLFAGGCGVRLARMTDIQKSERLAIERGRLPELDDQVDKARSYLIISEILLDFAGSAGREGDMEGLKALLTQYTGAIRDGSDALISSDQNAENDSDGFKEFEMALRDHARTLSDMSRAMSFDQRPPIDAALQTATAVREEILRRLFPRLTSSLRPDAGESSGFPIFTQ